MEVDIAFASEIEPCVGPTTVSESTCTRIPSYFSSCSIEPVGSVSVAVSVIGAGNGLPLESRITLGAPAISVTGGLLGSAPGMNSWTVPVTLTSLPTAAPGGGADEVKTKTPSDVLGSASSKPGFVWMKKPLLLTPVTSPVVSTTSAAKE